MRLYSRTHDVSCGIDLHARTMYLCVLDRAGQTLLHRNLPTRPEALLDAIAPFRSADLVVGCECLFAWYWLADLCEREGIPFALGHALGMRSIHGLKTKSDKLDSWQTDSTTCAPCATSGRRPRSGSPARPSTSTRRWPTASA